MKKLFGLILILALALATMFAFTGCGDPQKTDGNALTGWDYIEDKGELIVGLDDTFAPMGFRDESGELVGFDIDLAKAVGEELGVKIKFNPIDWNAKEMELA